MATLMKDLTALMHRGTDSLPWIDFGGGLRSQLPHINEEAGLFVIHSLVEPGYLGRLHRHIGHVYAITVAGAWKYLEHPEINTAGSYLYEPDRSFHTFKVLDDNEEPTELWAIIHGGFEYIDEHGNVLSVLDAAAARKAYEEGCAAQGLSAPDPLRSGA